MPPIIFLDIDGVIVPFGENVPMYPVFLPQCVDALKLILAAVPSARVVFSSTWRLPAHVNRLHEQWREHGFPESLAIDGTPDLREDPNVSKFRRRGLEIQAWLDANPGVSSWVVIDDEKSAIVATLDCDRCVFTDPARGLATDDVETAIKILALSPARNV